LTTLLFLKSFLQISALICLILHLTILLVEQNAKLALQTSSRAYVLESGEIILNGPADDLLADRRVRAAYLGE
jgi:ABC-type branched-subunit amino acid transport system ATPase component